MSPLSVTIFLLLAVHVTVQGRIIGCDNLGYVAESHSDLYDENGNKRNFGVESWDGQFDDPEEACRLYKEYMSRPFLPRGGERRSEELVRHQNMTNIQGDAACNGRGWVVSGQHPACHCFYEAAGDDCSQQSERDGLPVRGAVVYLLYGDKGSEKSAQLHGHLQRAISHLSKSFLDDFPYPVLVFHSKNFAEHMYEGGLTYLEALQSEASVHIRFVEIGIEYRESLKSRFEQDPPTGQPCGTYHVNYLHMGRFFEYLMFRHPVIREFDYLWRLDADLDLVLGVPCDVFDIMRRSHAVFGFYYYSDWEPAECGPPEGRKAAVQYAAEKEFVPNHLDILPKYSAYNGFWNVFDVKFWTSQAVMEFGEYMDALGLAYTHRMGEQVFYALATSLFISPSSLHQFAGVGPFFHRETEIIMGRREINGFNLIRDDVFCPEASKWDCDDFFECKMRDWSDKERLEDRQWMTGAAVGA